MSEKIRLLVADRDSETIHTIQELFQNLNFECEISSSESQALERLNSSEVHLAVLDLKLAVSGASNLIRAAANKDIPVVVLTEFDDINVIKSALQAGAQYFAEKPIKLDEIKTLVLKAVENQKSDLMGLAENFFKQAGLTTKEEQISRLVIKGMSSQEIAKNMKNKEKTIRNHLSSIYKKAGVSSRAEFFSKIFPV